MSTTCNQCGAPIENNEKFCQYCGSNINGNNKSNEEVNNSDVNLPKKKLKNDLEDRLLRQEVVPAKKKDIAICLAFPFGMLGLHRVYLGEYKNAAAYIFFSVMANVFSRFKSTSWITSILGFLIVISMIIDLVSYARMDKVKWCEKYGYKSAR